MFKKVICVAVALVMALSVAVIPVSAADKADMVLSSGQVAEAIEAAVSAIIGAGDGSEIKLSDDFAEAIAGEGNTARAISRAVSGFIFVEEDKIDEISDEIVDSCFYTVSLYNPNGISVYIAIDLDEHPELHDSRVFLRTVEKMLVRCDEMAVEEGVDLNADNYNPMSYEHLAGELALHMIIADVLTFAGGGSWNLLLDEIFEKVNHADLDIYEERFPPEFIRLVGRVVTTLLKVLFDR